MPPTTRREVRLSASLPGPSQQNGGTRSVEPNPPSVEPCPNKESLADQFELFRRKHISQNREIIKTNAIHQLRIKHLEGRILSLEEERVHKEMETISLVTQLRQLRHVIGTIHAGWEAIGQGLTLSAARRPCLSDYDHPDAAAHLPASNRITIEPNPSASAVVRSIARAPQGHLDILDEEDPSTLDHLLPMSPPHSSRQAPSFDLHHKDDWQQHLPPTRADESYRSTNVALHLIDAPSPLRSPELPAELQHVIASANSHPSNTQSATSHVKQPPPTSSPAFSMHSIPDQYDQSVGSSQHLLRRSGRKSSRRQSGYFTQDDIEKAHALDLASDPSPSAPSSEPYMPSETDSETMEGLLVYSGNDEAPMIRTSSHRRPPTPLVDITNRFTVPSTFPHDRKTWQHDDTARSADVTPRKNRHSAHDSASHSKHDNPSMSDRQSELRTPGGRKRKIPNHEPHHHEPNPMPTPARLFSAAIDAAPSTSTPAVVDDELEPQTGRTRRVRKSINYALPKLNTKMRKPDPSDLVPASTPHRSKSSTPASARGMVGSTGNLSDIRKLHEAATLRQSPAERTSSSRARNGLSAGDNDDRDLRMADLFELRQYASHVVSSNATTDAAAAFWNGTVDANADTSDDDSRVTSNADLGELCEIAELEAAMDDLCTADDMPRQVDTPRAPQPSMWPSRFSTQMSASSSTDSNLSGASCAASNLTAAKRPSLRRKTTTLPSRSRQSSVEQALHTEAVGEVESRLASGGSSDSVIACDDSNRKTEPSICVKEVVGQDVKKASVTARKVSSTDPDSELARARSAASSVTELGHGRPPHSSTGLVAGMKPKQRPASAGASLTARTTGVSTERSRTFSGATAARTGITQTTAASTSAGSLARSASTQRASLHSALTDQSKATLGQMTPRIGIKGLPSSTTPALKESPRTIGTPVLKPMPSTSSLASESSGKSSPALSVASVSSNGTPLSTASRKSLKVGSSAAAAQPVRAHAAGSSTSSSTASRDDFGARPNGLASSTTTSRLKPQPARSMPSLRRATDRTAVTSTPRITVRSSSSTLPTCDGVASIAASKVAKMISSTPASRSMDAPCMPTGLGIDFSDGSAGQELLRLTGEIHQVLQSSESLRDRPSSLSSAANSSSPTSKASSEDASYSNANLAKARRTSRRISGMTA